MSTQTTQKADTVVIGGGLAGIVSSLELLDRGQKVLLLDAGEEAIFGGLALRAFGGVWLVDTPIQRRQGLRDSAELALEDWLRYAEFDQTDVWPRRWAEHYIERCVPDVYQWLKRFGVGFLPAAQWPEKGLHGPGNSLPRYHVLWGCSHYMTRQLIDALRKHPQAGNLQIRFQHRVQELDRQAGRLCGCSGMDEARGQAFRVQAEHVIMANGGITGNMEMVRRHWPSDWPPAPSHMLNGCHPNNDGGMHQAVAALGGKLTHLDKHWNYAAGVAHPRPHFDNEGLSLIPCRSGLWMDYRGRRIGPQPLVSGFDTRELCKQVVAQPRPYTWQIINKKMMLKELAVSGGEHNPAFRDRNVFQVLFNLLLGDRWLYREMTEHCEDFVAADNLTELVSKMNALTQTQDVQAGLLEEEIRRYDAMIERGQPYHNDDQLRRIAQLRSWSGDRIRTCKFQRILDNSAGPLIAVRLQLITRKTLGGMQTDLGSRVLDGQGQAIPGLYAAGEAAGFGGGGITGLRSLEGHCLSGAILNAQAAARSITADRSAVKATPTQQTASSA